MLYHVSTANIVWMLCKIVSIGQEGKQLVTLNTGSITVVVVCPVSQHDIFSKGGWVGGR